MMNQSGWYCVRGGETGKSRVQISHEGEENEGEFPSRRLRRKGYPRTKRRGDLRKSGSDSVNRLIETSRTNIRDAASEVRDLMICGNGKTGGTEC